MDIIRRLQRARKASRTTPTLLEFTFFTHTGVAGQTVIHEDFNIAYGTDRPDAYEIRVRARNRYEARRLAEAGKIASIRSALSKGIVNASGLSGSLAGRGA